MFYFIIVVHELIKLYLLINVGTIFIYLFKEITIILSINTIMMIILILKVI